MKTSVFISSLLIAVHLALAYDTFQGLLKLDKPCFPVYEHKECHVTLEKIYDPPIKGSSRNPPTTEVFLFTPTTKDKAEQLHKCGGGLPPHSTFDKNCPTEVFIHGYADGLCRTAWQREMKQQLFSRSSCYNVILTDWTWGNFLDFPAAATDAKVVGQQIAYVLKKIARQTKYDCRKFHVVGHSYGAMAASYVGKFMQGKCRLGRLTSLDFAYAPFIYTPENERLNPTDALLVDTIHSDDRQDCYVTNFGDPRPVGHVNFYVNDGTHQYSCYPYAVKSVLQKDFFFDHSGFTGLPLKTVSQQDPPI